VCHSTLGRRMTVRGPDCGGTAAAAPPAFFATCVLVSMFSMSSRRRRPGCRTTGPMRPGSAAVVSRSPNGRLFARKMNTAVRRQGNQVCGGEHVAAGHDLAQVPAIAHLLVQGVSHSSGNSGSRVPISSCAAGTPFSDMTFDPMTRNARRMCVKRHFRNASS